MFLCEYVLFYLIYFYWSIDDTSLYIILDLYQQRSCGYLNQVQKNINCFLESVNLYFSINFTFNLKLETT